MALIESFNLPRGAKQVTVPKVGQMTMSDLTDGQDIIDEEDIGMTTVDLTASEVGAKIILTDKLVRQSSPNVKFGTQTYILQHPNAVFDIANTAVTASTTYPVPKGWSEDLLGNFWSGLRPLNNVPIFEDGNLSTSSGDDAIGVIADKSALAVLKSVDTRTERQRDASMRATEVVLTADYGVFELDDSRGAPLTFDAAAPATS